MNNGSDPVEGLSRTELRKFGLILSGGIIVFFGLLFPLLRGGSVRLISWPWLLALALVIISLIAPLLLKPINRAWLFIGNILGYVNTRIILGIIFVLIFTPTAFIFKFLGKDPMERTLDADVRSYRVDSDQPKVENLNRPY
jgi:hypothetical protein